MTLGAMFEALIDALMARTRYYGFYLYRVASVSSGLGGGEGSHTIAQHDTSKDEINDSGAGKLKLLRVGDVAGLDDAIGVDKLYGSHGIHSKAVPGSYVLLGFEGGEKSKPFVAFYLPSLPTWLVLDAVDYIRIITGTDDREKHVFVGSGDISDPAQRAVARINDTTANGQIVFTAGAGIVTISYVPVDAPTVVIGVLAGTALTFTPDPSSGGVIPLAGKITTASNLLSTL